MKRKTKKKLVEVILFLVKFNLLAIPMYILIYLIFSFQPLQNLVAYLSYKLLQIIGAEAWLNQSSVILTEGFKIAIIEISMDCTGWKSAYALFALAIATPLIELRKKIKFLLVSLPTLFLLNILRIAVTAYLSLRLDPQYFAIFHDFLWQWGLIAAVLGMWAIWLKYEKRI